MCNNKESLEAYLRYRWAQQAPGQLGGAVCNPAPGPSHVGGPSMLARCILMPLIDTNWLLQVQVDSEVNSNQSESSSGWKLIRVTAHSRPTHRKRRNNRIKKVLLGRSDGPAAPAAGKVSRLPRPAKKLKLQGNEYFQWKQRVLSSNLVRIINLHVRFSNNSLVFNCSQCILQIESLWMNIVAILFSKGQFNVSGRCCWNVVVDQQGTTGPTRWSNQQVFVDRIDTLVSIESTRWCRSIGF